jgi:hypothetical protein
LALARDGLYVGIGVRSNAGLLDDITTFEVDPEHFFWGKHSNAGTRSSTNVSQLIQPPRTKTSELMSSDKSLFQCGANGNAAASHGRVSGESIGDESTTTILCVSSHPRTCHRGLFQHRLNHCFEYRLAGFFVAS